MQKAVIYCRVSSAEQIDNTSLKTQEVACREWCAKNNLTVVQVFVDSGESAKTADRPMFLSMVARCRRERDIARVVVYRLDRFARSTLDHATFRAKLREVGSIVVSATEPVSDDPAGQLIESMLSNIAQFDNDVRSARAKDAMRAIKARGGWVHKPPYGFKLVRQPDNLPVLEPHEANAATIREAYAMVAGGQNPQTVYEALRPLVCRTVFYRVFRDPLYVKIDERGWNNVQVAMGKVRPRSLRAKEFPLRGTLICAACNVPMTASIAKGKYTYYHCSQPKHARIDVQTINESIAELLSQISGAFVDALPLFRDMIDRQAHLDMAQAAALKGQCEVDIADLEKQKDRLIDAMVTGRISVNVFDRKATEIDALLADKKLLLTASSDADNDVSALIDQAQKLLSDLPALWNRVQPANRARLLASLFPRGIVIDGKTVRTSATDSVFAHLCLRDGSFFRLAPPTGFEPVLLG